MVSKVSVVHLGPRLPLAHRPPGSVTIECSPEMLRPGAVRTTGGPRAVATGGRTSHRCGARRRAGPRRAVHGAAPAHVYQPKPFGSSLLAGRVLSHTLLAQVA